MNTSRCSLIRPDKILNIEFQYNRNKISCYKKDYCTMLGNPFKEALNNTFQKYQTKKAIFCR